MADTHSDDAVGAAEAAAVASDLASSNIRRYLELHNGAARQYNMRVVEATYQEVSRLASEAAALAAKSLRDYMKLHPQ